MQCTRWEIRQTSLADCDDSNEDKKDNSRNNDNNEQEAALFTYIFLIRITEFPVAVVRAASVQGMITK